jgi:tRNA modification GTPase
VYIGDTIAAIATPPGRGGIGVVRLSGPDSLALIAEVFRPSGRGEWRSHRMRHGWVVDARGHELDEALAVQMQAPRSYTGEDVVELQCHGSPAVLRHVVERLLEAGARLADPGEFTERAFLNGRLDLAQAEAVVDLIEARGTQAAAIAAGQLHGGLSHSLAAVRSDLIDLKALLEVQIDFADEEVSLDPHELVELQRQATDALDTLIASYEHGRRARDGARVAIVGRPNVGKSSLLNALLGEERAIVTAIAGTTRDIIEESIEIAGVPVVLSDTAGLRADAGDEVERIGIERTGAAIERAHLVLLVVDGSQPLTAADQQALHASAGSRRVIVVNKSDLPVLVDLPATAEAAAVVRASARQHAGLDELRDAIGKSLHADLPPLESDTVLTNARHRDALVKAREALAMTAAGLDAGQPADIVAVTVQDALDRIGEVTGTVTSEDVLDRVFSRFCLGK